MGFFNYLRDTAVLDIAGTVGFDFVVIDNEHTAMERETTEKLILAAELNHVVPFVRVPELIPYLMRNYMEMGGEGEFWFPMSVTARSAGAPSRLCATRLTAAPAAAGLTTPTVLRRKTG